MELLRYFTFLVFSLIKESKHVEPQSHRQKYKPAKANSQEIHGHIRLVPLPGQFSEGTGIVVVNYNNSQGGVCGDMWTDEDARFVCRNSPNMGSVSTKLLISKSYCSDTVVTFRRLGCGRNSKTLNDCNIELVNNRDLSNSSCGNDSRLAGVCCSKHTRGSFAFNDSIYLANCPATWNNATRLCYRTRPLTFNVAQQLPKLRLDPRKRFWTASRIDVVRIGRICSAYLFNETNVTNCADIQKYCFTDNKHFYGQQGDQCFCLNENEVKYYLPPIPCQDNCTDTDNRNGCGFQIYSLNVTENNKTDRNSLCIQVQFTEEGKIFRLEDCNFLGAVICWRGVCDENPCQNSGKCVPNRNNKNYTCLCEETYIGQNCGTDVCFPNPCKHNEICKRNETLTGPVCIESNETKRQDISVDNKKQGVPEKDVENTQDVIIYTAVALSCLLSGSIAVCFCRWRWITSRKKKGEQARSNSVANKAYGYHIDREDVYDCIDESKLDPDITTPLNHRKPVDVIQLEEYSTPSDALTEGQTVEYAETYDEFKLINHEKERLEEEKQRTADNNDSIPNAIGFLKNKNTYYILEEEPDTIHLQNEQNAETTSDKQMDAMKRQSSYEDTDGCIPFEKIANRTKPSVSNQCQSDFDYEDPAIADGIFTKTALSKCSAQRNIFENGIENIPEDVLRNLGIRIVKSDYSEYYAFKMLRRRSAELDRCKNIQLCDKPDAHSERDLKNSKIAGDRSKEDINEYDKLCHFAKRDSKRVRRYDHVDGFMFKSMKGKNDRTSDINRTNKRPNSV